MLRVLKNEYYLKHNGDVHKEKEKGMEGAVRPVTAGSVGSMGGIESLREGGAGLDGEEAERKERDAKDKERWARLRRVKSLFDIKAGKKLQRSASAKSKAA